MMTDAAAAVPRSASRSSLRNQATKGAKKEDGATKPGKPTTPRAKK